MQRVGPKFLGIHHYCAGLNYINRYQYRVTDKNRKYYLSRAVPEIDYVAKDMPPGFPLAGEIYLNRGIALQLMGKDAEALTDFNRALQRDSGQVQAYLAIADYHVKKKNKSAALDVVSTGLKNVPDNKRLQRRYLELGGKEPFPVAEAPTSPDAKAVPDDQVKPGSNDSVTAPSEPSASAAPMGPDASSVADPAPENRGDEEKATNESTKTEIGSPTNPYCRFCP
jgi:tetratricopeptide (TPR) repeat protein